MKVWIDHNCPFFLAHGGFGIQIEQTLLALQEIGVQAERLDRWETTEQPDILHFFGRPPATIIEMCHAKGIRFVMSELLTGQGSRGLGKLKQQGLRNRLLQRVLPPMYRGALPAAAYQQADAVIALTSWEKQIMEILYGSNPDKTHIVPNGVEEVFFREHSESGEGTDFLVCTATIHPRKRVLELAEAAVEAQIPVWIIGKPYSETEDYYRRFLAIQQKYPQWIRYEGPIDDRNRLAGIYASARGFVLLSAMESQSLSALEAAAGACPLLLSDLPWARSTFGDEAAYTQLAGTAETSADLKSFSDAVSIVPQTFKPLRWCDVATQLKSIYEMILSC